MGDTQTSTTDNTQVIQPKFANVGRLQRVEMTIPKTETQQTNPTQNNNGTQSATSNNEGATATLDANNGAANASANGAPAPTELSDDQLKEFFKSKGIEYDGMDSLKAKLNYKPDTAPTTEQLQEAAKAKEKRIVDKFVSGGGTYEMYTAMKAVAEADVAELSKNTLKKELKDAGFDDTQIDTLIKERYYQLSDEEIEEQGLDESDKQFKKRLKEHFANKLANRSLPIKNQAAGVLADLQRVIESEDLQAKSELQLSSNIEEQFKKLSRKDTYEIGEINKVKITPIESEVPESEIAEAFQKLIDPAKRKQFLENQDGSLNITNIANLIAENAKLKAAIKVSYHEGSTRTNAGWEKVFGVRSPYELGVGGSSASPQGKTPGQPVSYGKKQRVQPQRQ